MSSKSVQEMVREAYARIKSTTAAEVGEAVANGEYLVIDVREPFEWESGHIAGAMLVPRGVLELRADPSNPSADPLLSSSQDQKLLVYCAVGLRSALATDALNQMGFKDVTNLEGGFGAWAAEGLPVER